MRLKTTLFALLVIGMLWGSGCQSKQDDLLTGDPIRDRLLGNED